MIIAQRTGNATQQTLFFVFTLINLIDSPPGDFVLLRTPVPSVITEHIWLKYLDDFLD